MQLPLLRGTLESEYNSSNVKIPRFMIIAKVIMHHIGPNAHYSAAELLKVIDVANSVCESRGKTPELMVLRRLRVS